MKLLPVFFTWQNGKNHPSLYLELSTFSSWIITFYSDYLKMCIMKGFGKGTVSMMGVKFNFGHISKEKCYVSGFFKFLRQSYVITWNSHILSKNLVCLVLCTLLSYWMFSEEQYFCQKLYFSPLQKCVLKNVFLNVIKSHNLFLERILMTFWTILHGRV